MKFKLKTKSGPIQWNGTIPGRYRVLKRTITTDSDLAQFWTWLKYELPRVDFNPNQMVFGASSKEFALIQKEWGEKLIFE